MNSKTKVILMIYLQLKIQTFSPFIRPLQVLVNYSHVNFILTEKMKFKIKRISRFQVTGHFNNKDHQSHLTDQQFI